MHRSLFLNHNWKDGSTNEGGNSPLNTISNQVSTCICLKCDLDWDHIFSEPFTMGLSVWLFFFAVILGCQQNVPSHNGPDMRWNILAHIRPIP